MDVLHIPRSTLPLYVDYCPYPPSELQMSRKEIIAVVGVASDKNMLVAVLQTTPAVRVLTLSVTHYSQPCSCALPATLQVFLYNNPNFREL